LKLPRDLRENEIIVRGQIILILKTGHREKDDWLGGIRSTSFVTIEQIALECCIADLDLI
jgi:hypothetical protein